MRVRETKRATPRRVRVSARVRATHAKTCKAHARENMTGRLSSNTNTAEGTLTQESGAVRSVEGEVCGAVLVDE